MRTRMAAVVGLLLTVVMAGCGQADGGDQLPTAHQPGASATATATAGGLSEQEQMLTFARCMRDSGVPDFPDPTFNGNGGVSIDAPQGSDPQKVDAAMKTCKQYLPNGGEPPKLDPQRVEQLRRLAQCMRDKGITNFPDPTDGGIQVNGNTSGIDLTSATYQAAQKACAQFAPAPSGGPGPVTETGGVG